MNIDDPRLTAYALDECDHLGSDDRAEIEKALAGDPKLAAEIDDLRKLTSSLRTELHAEKGETLTQAQRAEVLKSTAERSKVVTPPRHRWWRSEVIGLSIAACAVIGLSTTVYYQAEHVRHLEFERERLLAQKAAATPALGLPVQVDFAEKDIDSLSASPLTSEPQLPELTVSDPAAASAKNNWAAQSGMISKSDTAAGTSNFGDLAAPAPSSGPLTGVDQTKLYFGAQPRPEEEAKPASSDEYSKRSTELSLGAEGMTASTAVTQGVTTRGLAGVPITAAGRVTGTRALSSAVSNSAGFKPKTVRDARGWVEDGIAPAKTESSKLASAAAGTAGGTVELRRELAEAEKRLRELPVALAKKVTTDTPLGEAADSKSLAAGLEYEQLGRRVEQLRESLQDQQDGESNTEAYDAIKDNPFLTVMDNPLSTFSIDVDTASYSNVRRFLNSNQRPPKGAVRIEELVNYFRYDYPQPKEKDPFGATMEVATCPWTPEHRLVRVGIKGREIPRNERPAANLVFLVDVSGSMQPENKLPLVKESLRLLTDQLGPDDSVSIAVYAGASGCVLEPTHDKEKVRTALSKLESGGSTNGAAGIQLAYDLAQRAFKKGGSNRVILCTDGDFNVGVTDQSQLISMIEGKAKTGIFLSVLGFGYGNLKDSTMEKLADKGNGFYGYIDTIAEGRRLFVEQLAGTLCTIAKDVKIQVEFNPAQVGSYRLIGYENRLLAKEDFNDDTKDAGEIGAGHTVTALYEVVPAGRVAPGVVGVDDLKYQKAKADVAAKLAESNSEMLTVKVRYKQPDADTSTKLEFPLTDSGTTWEKSTRDFRWAAAVAGFGMMLRESPSKGSLSWSLVEELASEGRAQNENAERAEFVQLVDKAKALSR